MSVEYPFGRTRTTAGELYRVIDTDTVREELSAANVPDPDEAIDSFIQVVPSLLVWLENHGRDYPWRRTTDPWKIFATEILLQRTRSDAVANSYTEFFQAFSAPSAVLEAEEDQVRDIVHPLGFTSHRVRTLREAAELCVHEYDGEVPADLEALKRPWRAGPYTARACLLFAFDEPLALVDTNTARITGRVFNYPLPAQPHQSDRMYRLLDALVPADASIARAFNLALLDLGALICTSENPDCTSCPLAAGCAYALTRRN